MVKPVTFDADIGLFTRVLEPTGFSAAAGWEPIEGAVPLGGPRDAAVPTEERTTMGVFSEKGRRGRAAFASEPIGSDDDLR